MAWEAVIGLEIHVELETRSKMFCGCPNTYGEEPNTVVCPVCLGHPGTLPLPNREAVRAALKLGAALGSTVHTTSVFYRKNYFYPDLPKGYQITQYTASILTGGSLRGVRIERVNLEEETAKSYHAEDGTVLLDFNRAGIPLLEIVTFPDLRSPRQAREFLEHLRLVILYLGISGCDMEKGQLRVDANLSVRPEGSTTLGTKVEVKNMNSFKAVEEALSFEFQRQVTLLEQGEGVVQETRLWDEHRKETRPMRSKEEAHDYRYFPEPDLPPLVLDPRWVEEIRRNLPELPEARRARYVSWGLSEKVVEALLWEPALGDYVEAVAEGLSRKDLAGNWVATQVLRVLNERGIGLEAFPLSPEALRELLKLIEEGVLHHSAAQQVFEEMLATGRSARKIVRERNLEMVRDTSLLERVVAEVIQEHPEIVEKYRSGKKGVLGVLIGAVMRKTGGKADPQVVRELLLSRLES